MGLSRAPHSSWGPRVPRAQGLSPSPGNASMPPQGECRKASRRRASPLISHLRGSARVGSPAVNEFPMGAVSPLILVCSPRFQPRLSPFPCWAPQCAHDPCPEPCRCLRHPSLARRRGGREQEPGLRSVPGPVLPLSLAIAFFSVIRQLIAGRDVIDVCTCVTRIYSEALWVQRFCRLLQMKPAGRRLSFKPFFLLLF